MWGRRRRSRNVEEDKTLNVRDKRMGGGFGHETLIDTLVNRSRSLVLTRESWHSKRIEYRWWMKEGREKWSGLPPYIGRGNWTRETMHSPQAAVLPNQAKWCPEYDDTNGELPFSVIPDRVGLYPCLRQAEIISYSNLINYQSPSYPQRNIHSPRARSLLFIILMNSSRM